MKFEMFYLLAIIRGWFPDDHKGSLVFGRPDKNTVKQMYYRGGFIPYRINSLVTYILWKKEAMQTIKIFRTPGE